MNESPTGQSAAHRLGASAGRIARVWRALPPERRLAACAALGLFLTLFLPWYQETVIAPGKATNLQSASATLTGWGAFSFVEAAVLLVAAGVLTLLFQRAEARAFHLPGGDGWVITAAGLWTCVLVMWRIFDKQGTSSAGRYATTSGIEWGIFVALAVAALLAYAGSRIRVAHEPEPPLPGEKPSGGASPPGSSGERPLRRHRTEARPVRPLRPMRAGPPEHAGEAGRGDAGERGEEAGRAGETGGAEGAEQPTRAEDPTLPADPPRALDLTVPEVDDPPALQLPSLPRRARTPPRRAVRADEQLTIPLEERRTED